MSFGRRTFKVVVLILLVLNAKLAMPWDKLGQKVWDSKYNSCMHENNKDARPSYMENKDTSLALLGQALVRVYFVTFGKLQFEFGLLDHLD